MKKIKTASSKATQKLKRTFSKLAHRNKGSGGGGLQHTAAERDRARAEGLYAGSSMDAAALGYAAPPAEEVPATGLEWAAAAGVMPREQWAVHLRDLETSSGGVGGRYLSGSSVARRGDDEEGEEDAQQREEERRRRREKREKREKESRRRRRREEAEAEERKASRRNSRHSHRSRRSSSEEDSSSSSSSGDSSSERAREREERRRKREKEKRRRQRERDEREEPRRRKRESRRGSLEARYLADARPETGRAAGVHGNVDVADYEPQVPVEEDEESYHRDPSTATSDDEARRTESVGNVAELEDVLDEARVKSPPRDRPSERDEGADDEDGYEDYYDYASSGPIGAGMTESDGSLVVSTQLDRLPPARAPNAGAGELGKPMLTSLGVSPPPDDEDASGDCNEGAAKMGAEDGTGVTELQEMVMSPAKQQLLESAGGGAALTKRRASEVFLSDTDSGARRESAPGGDAAHS